MVALAGIFKALGDGTRIRIVQLLARQGEMHVCELTEALGMQQPAVSYHIMVLKRAGLLCSQRERMHIRYSLNRETIAHYPLAFMSRIVAFVDSRSAGEQTPLSGTVSMNPVSARRRAQ